MSSAVAGCPNPRRAGSSSAGRFAITQPANSASIRLSWPCLRMDVAQSSIPVDSPALDAIIVVARLGTTDLDQRIPGRLPISCLVHAPALEHRLLAIPGPGNTKSRVALGQHGFLQFCGTPNSPPVHFHLDLPDPSPYAPGKTTNPLKAAPNLLAP